MHKIIFGFYGPLNNDFVICSFNNYRLELNKKKLISLFFKFLNAFLLIMFGKSYNIMET